MRRWKIGDRVQIGNVCTPEYDHGTIVEADGDYVRVRWSLAEECYWEDGDDLSAFVDSGAVSS